MSKEYSIRPMEVKDLGYFNKVRNSVREWLHDNSYFTIHETIKWFLGSSPEFYILEYWCEPDHSGTPIGYFRTSNRTNTSIWVGLDIEPHHQNKGHATKAYPHFLEYLKQRFGVNVFYLRVLKKNNVALHVYKKLGFKPIEETDIDYKMEKRICLKQRS